MNLVERLNGKTVVIDSAPLIYFMERHPTFYALVRPVFEALERGEFVAMTSSVTIAEVLPHPIRHGRFELVSIYRDFFAQYLPVISVTAEIAETAARLRAGHGLRTPDAIQVGTALVHQAELFLTNDSRLGRLKQPEVLSVADI